MKYSTLKKLVKENTNAKIKLDNGVATVWIDDKVNSYDEVAKGHTCYFKLTPRGNLGMSKSEVWMRLAQEKIGVRHF
jgi:hypothetical protein